MKGSEIRMYKSQDKSVWVCHWYFTVTTSNQFTDEYDYATASSRWALLAIWKAWRAAKYKYADMRCTDEERRVNGWAP